MELLYCDKDIVVCIKPVGMDAEFDVSAALGGEIFPIHRLDKNVGGVMVYAKTRQAAAALSRAVQEGTMVKEYVAWCMAVPRKPGTGKTCCGRTAGRTRCSWSQGNDGV